MKTFEQISAFNTQADVFIKRAPANVHTKLGYALKKVSEGSVNKAIRDYQHAYRDLYNEMVQKVMIEKALTDKATGAILYAARGSQRPYLFDAAGLTAVIDAENKFNDANLDQQEEWSKKEFEITPHFAVELPSDLTAIEREAFTGFVIPE